MTTDNQQNLAVIAITSGGAELARRIGADTDEVHVYLPARFRRQDACRYFDRPLSEQLPQLFAGYRGLVCIMATGIVVRLLAPCLQGKDKDPAVVVMDEKGRFAVSLLSGHLGGANDLAEELAEMCGGQAVITTATDVNGLPAWDEIARRQGLTVEPVRNIVALNSLLLEGKKVVLVDPEGRVSPYYEGVPGVFTARTFFQALDMEAEGRVFVTHRHIPQAENDHKLLLLRPRDLVVGLGCNRGTSVHEIEAAVREVLQKAFLSFSSIGCLASIEEKRDEEGLVDFARLYGFPIEFYPAAALNAVEAPSADSAHALAAVGAKGVCEPAALITSGGGTLLVKKKKTGNLTVAVAKILF